MKIYTRKGDDGTTSLWYGGRVAKDDERTEAYGSLDEAVSALGAARALCGADAAELAADLLQLQEDIFVAGAELATAPEAADRLEDGISRVTEEMVGWAEERIDHYMEQVDLPPQFVIPGGTQLSAALDLARAVTVTALTSTMLSACDGRRRGPVRRCRRSGPSRRRGRRRG